MIVLGVLYGIVIYLLLGFINFMLLLSRDGCEEYWVEYAEARDMNKDIVVLLALWLAFPVGWMHNLSLLLLAIAYDVVYLISCIGSSQTAKNFKEPE